MGYYLLDHRNPHGDNFYTSRRGSVLGIVVHITAGLQDQGYQGADLSCEGTARYAAETSRDVSWHSGSDSDSSLKLLPDTYTAFHVKGYNSRTIGHEISKLDDSWRGEPARWVTDTLKQAANCLRPRAKAFNIPLRLANRRDLDLAIATGGKPVGFLSHHSLDPERRTDPGPDFPWARFFDLLANGSTPPPVITPSHQHSMPVIGHHDVGHPAAIKDVQGHLNAWRRNRELSIHPVDGKQDDWFYVAVTTFQRWYGLKVDGIVGPIFWSKLHSITKGARA